MHNKADKLKQNLFHIKLYHFLIVLRFKLKED